MISIYTGEEVSRTLAPHCSCAYCCEAAFEIVNGVPLCGIPGNHADMEQKKAA